MRKVYEYRNKAEAEIVIPTPSGRTRFKYKFSGGVMDPKNKIHAKHTTDNEVMQRVLENSEYFNKTIFLVATFDSAIKETPALVKKTAVKPTEAPKGRGGKPGKNANQAAPVDETKEAEGKPSGTEDAPQIKVIEDATSIGAAISVLMSHGVNAADVTTIEGAKKAAKELNISFPNLK